MSLDSSQNCQTDGFHTVSLLNMHTILCIILFLKENMTGLKMDTVHIERGKGIVVD